MNKLRLQRIIFYKAETRTEPTIEWYGKHNHATVFDDPCEIDGVHGTSTHGIYSQQGWIKWVIDKIETGWLPLMEPEECCRMSRGDLACHCRCHCGRY